jgi:hypothetical protein
MKLLLPTPPIDHWRSWCKGWILRPAIYTYIHTPPKANLGILITEGVTLGKMVNKAMALFYGWDNSEDDIHM